MAVGGGDGEFGYNTCWGNAPDLIAKNLGEPKIAVGTSRDLVWVTVGCGNRKVCKGKVGGDSTDSVAKELREPEVAVSAQRDIGRAAVGDGNLDLGNCAARGNPPNLF